MAIIGEQLKKYVYEQINVRQNRLSSSTIKTDEDLIYLDAKTAWVKMASGVSVTPEKLMEIGYASGSQDINILSGMGLAQKHVLFSGLADYKGMGVPLQTKQGIGTPFSQGTDPSSYEIDPQFGIVPRPGIKDMSVKCLNRGSLKKAKIKVRVENKYQLQILDILYLRLGYTVLLEWGNSHYYDSNGKLNKTPITLIEKKFFEKDKMNFTSFLNDIEAQRRDSSGNYDGFIGKVSNFDWSFNDDGSYDISLELISLGDVIESLKSNVTLDEETNDYILTATSGSSNITITSTSDPINNNRTLNSLFSILFLWKDFYKAPQKILENASNQSTYPYDIPNGISIDYTELPSSGAGPTINERAFIGDCLEVPSAANLNFTTGDFTLELDLGYLSTRDATPGSYDTYDFTQNSGAYQFRPLDGKYGAYNMDDVGKIRFTLKGNFASSNPANPNQQLIDQIINTADPSTKGYTFTSSSIGFKGSNGSYKRGFDKDTSMWDWDAFRFWLTYGQWDETLNPGIDFAKTQPLLSGTTTKGSFSGDNKENYKTLSKFFNIDIMNYVFVDDLGAGAGETDDPDDVKGTFIVSEGDAGSKIAATTLGGRDKLYKDSKSILNIMWNLYKTGNSAYGGVYLHIWKSNIPNPGQFAEAQFHQGDGSNTERQRRAFGGWSFDRFGYKRRGKNVKYSNETFDSIGNKGESLPFKARVDIPLVKLNITNSTTSTVTVANPLKKFKDGDVCRLYRQINNQNSYNFYMRFGALLQTLKNDIISRVDVGAAKNKDNPNIILINNESNPNSSNFVSYMQNKPNLTSFDTTKCFFKTTLEFASDGTNPGNKYKTFENKNGKLKTWEINKTEGNSMNIYLSFKFIGEVLSSSTDSLGNVSIYNFIKGLCDGMNRAFANVTNLEPVIDETKNELSIVDSSKNKSTSSGPYELNPYGFLNDEGSFVRKVDLKTAITPAYATMVTVGATAGGYVKGVEATAFANWNKGVNDRYKTSLKPANATTTGTAKKDKKNEIRDAILSFQKTWLTSKNSMLTPLGIDVSLDNTGIPITSATPPSKLVNISYSPEMIETNKQIADEYFRAYHAQQSDGSSLGFIPFNVSLKMDGISGIKIYNEIILNTRFLPSNYASSLSFVVTGVDHHLKNNDWETSLKMTLIPTSKKSYDIPPKLSFTKRNINFIQQNVVVPSAPVILPSGTSTVQGDPGGVYLPPQLANAFDGTNYVDITKTMNSSKIKQLADMNGGTYPLTLYTKPGDSSGTIYGKVIRKVTGFGGRNQYEANPAYENYLVRWVYDSNGLKISKKVSKFWAPTLTQIAQHLDSKGMWNSAHIKSWSPGYLVRDVTPSGGVDYGRISGHAFAMAIDINSGVYSLGSSGVTKYNNDLAAGVKTALVHDEINKNFCLVQGGAEKVFWAISSRDAHHFAVVKLI